MSKKAGKPRTDSNRQRVLIVARCPALHAIAAARPYRAPGSDGRGRPSVYPDWVMWVLLLARFIYPSRNELVRELSDRDFTGRYTLWEDLRDLALDAGLEMPPTNPPAVDHMKSFTGKFEGSYLPGDDQPVLNPEDPRSEEQDGPINRTRAVLRSTAIQIARGLGNLDPDSATEQSALSPRHVIHGDGTYIQRQTYTELVTDADTGQKRVLGGVTDDPETARVQTVITSAVDDGKGGSACDGINMVFVSTITPFGEVVLDVDASLSAESKTAMRLIEGVITDAGGGVQAVTWDGALTGWHARYLLSRYGITLINYLPAASRKPDREIAAQASDSVKTALDKAGSRVNAHAAEAARASARRSLARKRYGARDLLLGLTLRQSDKKAKAAVIESRHHRLGKHTHTGPDGHPCHHHLYVDDGALFDVDPATMLKKERAALVGLSRHPDDGRIITKSTWSLRCNNEVTGIEITHNLAATRGATPGRQLTPTQAAIEDLRFVHHLDQDWSSLYVVPRNSSESGNNWRKQCLSRGSKTGHRATSLHYHSQRLDMIALALLRTCMTWHAGQQAPKHRQIRRTG